MRRVFISLLLLFSAVAVWAQQTPKQWIASLNSSLGERYATFITVSAYDEDINGYFMVDGDGYYIELGVMEVYSDGRLRYEINNERKEVTEDRVNLEAVDLLTNPTRAFKFVDSEYDTTIDQTLSNGVVLKLVPKADDMGIAAIYLELQKSGAKVLPTSITYDYDGQTVTITLAQADVADVELPRWSEQEYRAYDMVSFL